MDNLGCLCELIFIKRPSDEAQSHQTAADLNKQHNHFQELIHIYKSPVDALMDNE